MDVPVVSWFEEEAPPPVVAGDEAWACPVSLLRPWRDRAAAARGSTGVVASRLDILSGTKDVALRIFSQATLVPENRIRRN
jgi:hypothetical protein